MNQPPQIPPLSFPLHSRPNESIELALTMSEIAFEEYVRYNIEESLIENERETMSLHWYVSAGSLDVSFHFLGNNSTNARSEWIAPRELGRVFFWLVVIDSRGGTSWLEHRIDVSE